MQFSVEHLGLPARDPAALRDWYVKTLGAELVFDSGQQPPAYFLRLPGGVMLEIYQSGPSLPDTGNNSLAGWRHVALHVSAIEPVQADLVKKGVNFTEAVKPAAGGGRVLFFSDAEGNLLHLVERPPDSVFYRAN